MLSSRELPVLDCKLHLGRDVCSAIDPARSELWRLCTVVKELIATACDFQDVLWVSASCQKVTSASGVSWAPVWQICLPQLPFFLSLALEFIYSKSFS